MDRTFYVYIITNKWNTVLYVGVTNNLEVRIWQHKNKVVKGFSYKHNLYKLVYYETFSNSVDAIYAEKKIKGWTRKKKIDLIERENPEWMELGNLQT